MRNSVCHSATIYANAIMHAGTTVDTFLRENLVSYYPIVFVSPLFPVISHFYDFFPLKIIGLVEQSY
jgi:hypothetical protein